MGGKNNMPTCRWSLFTVAWPILVPVFDSLVAGMCTVVYICAAKTTTDIFALDEGVFRVVDIFVLFCNSSIDTTRAKWRKRNVSTAAGIGSVECTWYHIIALNNYVMTLSLFGCDGYLICTMLAKSNFY